jgi:hypothetical protein
MDQVTESDARKMVMMMIKETSKQQEVPGNAASKAWQRSQFILCPEDKLKKANGYYSFRVEKDDGFRNLE